MAPSLIVLKTGSTFDELARTEGDFEDWFLHGLAVRSEAVEIVDARSATVWPKVSDLGGVVITGSPEMVTDHPPWLEAAAGWLRDAVAVDKPILGVCFGHQLLAHALGGVVDWNPGGKVYGTVEVRQLDAGGGDALLGVLPREFAAHSAHSQSVLELPAGAVALAESSTVPIQAARYGARAWGVQFHPEFSESIMRAYVKRHAAAAAGAKVGPSEAGRILGRFGEWFR